MDEETLTAEINSFIQSKNVDEKTKDKMTSRLKQSIHFMADLGVGIFDIPSKAQYDKLNEYLHTLIQPRGKHKGQKFSESVIRDWKNLTEKFYDRNGKRSDLKTIPEPQITIPEFEAASVPDGKTNSTEFSHTVSEATTDNHNIPKGEKNMTDNQTINAENSALTAEAVQTPSSPVKEIRKAGRPESTGRSEKFTLYMTPELWKKIRMLADLDEDNITDFMNIILENYCDNERSEDLEFLYGLERIKQERRLKKSNH